MFRYMFSRNIGLSFCENVYMITMFLTEFKNHLLSEVGFLIELNDELRQYPWSKCSETAHSISDGYPRLESYGRHLGYRFKIITNSHYKGFEMVNYDVSLAVAGNSIKRFLMPDRRLIIPVENINGYYQNIHDTVNAKEISNAKELQKLLKILS